MRLALFLVPVLLSGCILDELSNAGSGVDPGGTVAASVPPGPMYTTAALAHAKSEPMVVDGASTKLTFSLTAGDDLTGGTAFADLKTANASITLNLTTTTRTRLEVHLDGGGCLAQTGTIHLRTDANNHIAGDFTADGAVTGGTQPCRIDGTLADVPVDR